MPELHTYFSRRVALVSGRKAQTAGADESTDLHASGFFSNGCPLACRNREKCAHDGRVKQFPRCALNFVARYLEWHSGTVWPVGGHGVKTVGHGKDSGA
jgi:hypothetical protein